MNNLATFYVVIWLCSFILYQKVTAECTHHHLNYTEADIPDGFTQLKCLPPIRDEVNQELLWDGIREGVINQVYFKFFCKRFTHQILKLTFAPNPIFNHEFIGS